MVSHKWYWQWQPTKSNLQCQSLMMRLWNIFLHLSLHWTMWIIVCKNPTQCQPRCQSPPTSPHDSLCSIDWDSVIFCRKNILCSNLNLCYSIYCSYPFRKHTFVIFVMLCHFLSAIKRSWLADQCFTLFKKAQPFWKSIKFFITVLPPPFSLKGWHAPQHNLLPPTKKKGTKHPYLTCIKFDWQKPELESETYVYQNWAHRASTCFTINSGVNSYC